MLKLSLSFFELLTVELDLAEKDLFLGCEVGTAFGSSLSEADAQRVRAVFYLIQAHLDLPHLCNTRFIKASLLVKYCYLTQGI